MQHKANSSGIEQLTPVDRTHRLFLQAWGHLFPTLNQTLAKKAWSDMRTTIELEQISDLAKAMARAAIVANQVRENRVMGVRR